MPPAVAPAAGSMKPRIFVTGPPGVGKSTLIMRVLENLKRAHPQVSLHGFVTKEMRDAAGERVGFQVITMDGRKARLATASALCPSSGAPRVGKYNVDLPQFEGLVLPELERGKHDIGLCVLDEVGKMEFFSPTFFPTVWEILDSRNAFAVLGTIPISRTGRDLPQVEKIKKRPDVEIYTLSQSNREDMSKVVFTHLQALVEEHHSEIAQ